MTAASSTGAEACLRCGAVLEAVGDAQTLVACLRCGAELVGEARELRLRTAGGEGRNVSTTVALDDAFSAKYRLGAKLGAGAMGAVYLATDLRGGRRVAVKFMLQARSDDLRRRFMREGSLLMRIRDPHVMRLLDLDQLSDHPYLVSEYVEGGSLRGALIARGHLGFRDAARVVADALRGLHAVHAAGVIHRDVKPENVLLTGHDRAKIADMGIAHVADSSLTMTGALIGTPAYMAPEQVSGDGITPQTDIFAMGLILAEALLGRCPRKYGSLIDVIKQARTPLALPRVELLDRAPAAVVRLIDRMVQHDPAARPASALDAACALETLLVHELGFAVTVPNIESSPQALPSELEELPEPVTIPESAWPAGRPLRERIRALVFHSWTPLGSTLAMRPNEAHATRLAFLLLGAIVPFTGLGMPAFVIFAVLLVVAVAPALRLVAVMASLDQGSQSRPEDPLQAAAAEARRRVAARRLEDAHRRGAPTPAERAVEPLRVKHAVRRVDVPDDRSGTARDA